LFPKPTKWEHIRQKSPSVYGSIEHTFYAFRKKEPPLIHDMWNKDKPEMNIRSPRGYTYFSLNAMVGVGAKGKNNIKSVHIRFVLLPMRRYLSEPEVVSIIPTNISRTVGEIKEMQKYENERSAGGGVKASGGYGSIFAGITGGIDARIRKQSLSSKVKESTLPNELLIANASGTANRAIWEFYRGEGIEAIGQYNVEIIFRLQGCPPYEERFCYCVDWNIEVNGRKLWDHKVELENKRWNVVFNGKKLMDHMHKDEKKELMELMNKNDKEELIVDNNKTTNADTTNGNTHNVIEELIDDNRYTFSWQTIDLKKPAKNQSRLKMLKEIIEEDDPDIDKRLLRPLKLLASEEKQQSDNLNPSPSSWTTKIKDIEVCPYLVVEAIVLSDPNKIKEPRNSKPDATDYLTYVLLGDETGLTVLIEQTHSESSKLDSLKKDEKVKVIGALRKEVCYRDLEGLQPILKFRQTDLYVTEFTRIENSKDKIGAAVPVQYFYLF
jgi:hypothetical protein